MNLVRLSAAAFAAGFGLGYAKFYLLGEISRAYPLDEKAWVIQAVGALITLGPFLAFAVSAPLAAAFPKAVVMCAAGFGTAVVLLIGVLNGWTGTAWLYLFLAGLVMGVFNSAKNAAVPLESGQTGRSTELVNALLGTTYILGLLTGIPTGTAAHERSGELGGILLCLSFVSAGILGWSCRFPSEPDHLRPFSRSLRVLGAETGHLARKYTLFLLSSPVLWGVASAASLAVAAYAEAEHLGSAVRCSLMAVYPVIGVMIGYVISGKCTGCRKTAIVGTCIGMAVNVLAIPGSVMWLKPAADVAQNGGIYWVATGLIVLLGMQFGIATNLIEAEYFRLTYAEKKEGTGAALLSALTALFPFLLGGFTGLALFRGWLSHTQQFVWLAGVCCIAAVMGLGLRFETNALEHAPPPRT